MSQKASSVRKDRKPKELGSKQKPQENLKQCHENTIRIERRGKRSGERGKGPRTRGFSSDPQHGK